ncbi:MAG: hypothetical protein ACRD0G_12175 [Acidimicrobiales bacterium]
MTRLRFLVLATLVIVVVGASALVPARADDPLDPLYPITQPLDLLTFFLSSENTSALMPDAEGANRYFMPDWNNNGVHGEDADLQVDDSGVETVGRFRYPCVAIDGAVTYETVAGDCVAGDTPGAEFQTGEVRRLYFIVGNGFRLSGTLFVPHEVLDGTSAPAPGLVITNGGFAPARMYYLYSMTAARAGYVVFNFDFSGQGTSEGDPFQATNGPFDTGPCQIRRWCVELQDAMRWFTGAPITRWAGAPGTHNPAYQPAGENAPNPVLERLDVANVAIMGQSGGSHVAINYPWFQATGLGADGQPLPPAAAVVALSGFAPTRASIPIQAQTADLDFPLPGTLPHTNGPVGTKDWYDSLRASGQGDDMLQLIVIESGSHGDTTNLPWLPRVAWSQALSTTYAVEFLDCHLRDDPAACTRAVTPLPHLSRAVASEYDPDGPAGPSPSRCMTIPDRSTLGQLLDPLALLGGLIGQPPYDCQP